MAGLDLKPLASQLSKTAQIYYEGSELFSSYTVRWSNLSPPTANVVIAPGTENDVSKIVSTEDTLYDPVFTVILRSSLPPSRIFLSSLTMGITGR